MQRLAMGFGVLLCGLGCLLASAAPAADGEKGKNIYDSRCAFCHGKTGKGDGPAGKALTPPPPDFSAAAFWKTTTAEGIANAIEHGKPNTSMIGFKGSLTADQIADLVAYLETLKPKP